MCVQDPTDDGLHWDDNSNHPIPLGLDIYLIKKVYMNWIARDEFYVQFKIYCDPKGCFDTMIKNKSNLCLIFQFNIISIANVETKLNYKIWISKDKKNSYNVINTNSTIIESKIIKDKE